MSDRQRPLLATVICICTIFISSGILLRVFHLRPPLDLPPDHKIQRHILEVVEPVLNLFGVYYLWRMRPVAWLLFAAEALIVALNGLYLTFIDPSEHMRVLRATHHAASFYLLSVVFELLLTAYVWRIVTRPSTSNEIG